jgi:hypothetical protein
MQRSVNIHAMLDLYIHLAKAIELQEFSIKRVVQMAPRICARIL